jgi:hypothetical protein
LQRQNDVNFLQRLQFAASKGRRGARTFEEILRHSKENYEKHIAFFSVLLYNIDVWCGQAPTPVLQVL